MNRPELPSLLDFLGVMLDDDLIQQTPWYERIDTVYGIHAHQCGYDHRDRNRCDDGCGFMWAHDGEQTRKVLVASEYEHLHTCPRCGKGPWKSLLHIRSNNDILALFEATKGVHNG